MNFSKPHLRKIYNAKRAELETPEAEHLSRAISSRAAAVMPQSMQTLSGYISMRAEVNVENALKKAHQREIATCLPCIVQKAAPLVFRAWSPGAPLLSGMYECKEPAADAAVVTPDVLLVPMLAFTRKGQRLGYGGGYYDRTLAQLRQAGTLKAAIGIAFAVQEVESLPDDTHDALLDYIVTESEIIKI
jgi:5-formyltetrahydrofolate cyclo-ligase